MEQILSGRPSPKDARPVVTKALPLTQAMIELRGYIDEKGNRRFAGWFERLDPAAAAKATIALARLEQANFGTKKRQQQNILTAPECWTAYKRRKRMEIQ